MKKKLLCAWGLILVICLTGCAQAVDNKAEVKQSETVVTLMPEEPAETLTAAPEPTLTPTEKMGDMSIKDFFAEHGVKAGTCMNAMYTGLLKMNDLLLSQYNSVTMENSMKPDYIFDKAASTETGELEVKFPDDAIQVFDWARENGFAMRGHTIVWYSQTPDWIFYEDFDTTKALVSRDVMLARLESAMKNVFGTLEELGYADLFYAYDIVNECMNDDGTIRESKWTETIGEDYVWYAFYYARQYAPEYIDLYINDYNEQFKYKSTVKLIETLVDDEGNYLLDGIGLQGHLYTKDSIPTYLTAVDALSATGLKLEITELDVCLGTWQNILEANDETLAAQHDFYYDLIGGLMKRIDEGTLNMDSITFWGVTDMFSWRSDRSPLLFDAKLEPKPAFFGVMQTE